MNSSVANRRGFTLIEVLVAMAIVGILSVSLMEVMRQVNVSSMAAERSSALAAEAHLAAESIRDTLRPMMKVSEDDYPGSQRPRFYAHNGTGNFDYWTVDDGTVPSGPDDVDWISFNTVDPIGSGGSHPSDRVTFTLLITDQTGVQGEWVLIRNRERHDADDDLPDDMFPPVYTDISSRNTTPTVDRPVAVDVNWLTFQFYDADTDSWYDEWDSDDTSLTQVSETGDYPDAIEFAFRVHDPTDRVDPQWFRGMVRP